MEITITSGFVSFVSMIVMLITFGTVFLINVPSARTIFAWTAGVVCSALTILLIMVAALLAIREETIEVCEQANPGTKCVLEAVAKRS